MKRIHILGLVLVVSVIFATSALAAPLTANHTYQVQLFTMSASGHQNPTAAGQMNATTDANGKLTFQFSDAPDTSTAPFLMVQVMDSVNGQNQVVRQTLVPAPLAGQQVQMGINEVSYRQTQAALQAMQSAAGSGNAAFHVMFPLTMIPSGAISSADAGDFGRAADDAATTFQNYLTQNGVTADQMTAFQGGLLDAMRSYAATNKSAVDQTNPTTATNLYGQAGAQFMTAMIQAGTNAGINPALLAAAYDQAGQAIDNSASMANLPTQEIAALQANFMLGAQECQLQSQMLGYNSAMREFDAQTQNFTDAVTKVQSSMVQTHQQFQQVFADQTALPDQSTIDQAFSSMQTAMQNAFGTFDQATTADSTQVDSMLGVMANAMGGSGGGMMGGGGMMSGSTLSGMGFGMMQTTLGGAQQNWSTMMVAAGNLIAAAPNLSYPSATGGQITTDLTSQLTTAGGAAPTAPDWSQLPEGPDKSLLELQYDLMLVHLIDMQAVANATQNGVQSLTQSDLATISATDLANRQMIRQSIQGLSDTQMEALMAALTPFTPPQFLAPPSA